MANRIAHSNPSGFRNFPGYTTISKAILRCVSFACNKMHNQISELPEVRKAALFQFSDREFSDPIATSLKMWKKINSFIVIIAFFVTLEKKNRNPQARNPLPPKNISFTHSSIAPPPPPYSKTCCAVPVVLLFCHGGLLHGTRAGVLTPNFFIL